MGLFENFICLALADDRFVLVWTFLWRPMMSGHGGLMGMGKSRAKAAVSEIPSKTASHSTIENQ